MSTEENSSTTAVAEAPDVQGAPTEGSPATSAASDAASSPVEITPEQKMLLEARKRFDRIADVHERQDGTDDAEAPPASESQPEGDRDTAATQAKPEESATGAEPPEGFDDAVNAMLRDNISSKRIEKWFQEDPADFMETATRMREKQKEIDRRISGQFKPKSERQATDEATGRTEAPAAQAQVEPPKDFIDASKRYIAEALKGIEGKEVFLDDEAGAQLLSVFGTGLAEQMGSLIATEMAKRDTLIQQLHQRDAERETQAQTERVNSEINAARHKLSDKYPGLKDDARLSAVLDKYDLIVRGIDPAKPQYQSVEEVFTEAAKWVFSDENPANAADRIKSNLFRRSQQQQRGLPAARVSPAVNQKLTADQRARQAFDKIADKYEGVLAS